MKLLTADCRLGESGKIHFRIRINCEMAGIADVIRLQGDAKVSRILLDRAWIESKLLKEISKREEEER